MKRKTDSADSIGRVIQWIARSFSILAIFVILIFVVGEGFNPFKFTSEELLLSIFFPVFTLIGLIVAWKYELIGGLISVAGLVLFYIFHQIISQDFPEGWAFLVFTAPAFLFILYAALHKNLRTQ
ncbi:MAG: hypothetical protein RO257_06360 [Candidatus Kapabacteria bacterium]|nr:hypothetical protein [Candidatus Kapabacteria bacterium]